MTAPQRWPDRPGAWGRAVARAHRLMSTNRGAAVAIVGVLAVIAAGCDRGRVDGDLSIDNRTDDDLVVVLFASTDDIDPAPYVSVSPTSGDPGMIRAMDGCGPAKLEVQTRDGEVVATLPPLPWGEIDCKFTWVVTDDVSYIVPTP